MYNSSKIESKQIKFNDWSEVYRTVLLSTPRYKVYPDKISHVINSEDHMLLGWYKHLAPASTPHEKKMLNSILYEIHKRFYNKPLERTQ